MSGDMMPKQQYDFIKGIQDNMLEASNMTEDDAWRFGFLIWQHQEWICKYLTDRKTENSSEIPNNSTISKMEQVEDDAYFLELMGAVERGEISDAGANQAWYEYINHKDEPQTEPTDDNLSAVEDEPQTEEWYTYQDEQEYRDRWEDEPQTERSE